MTNLVLFLLFTFYQTIDLRIDLGKYYDIQKQEKEHGYVETFTIIDEQDKQQIIISITKVEVNNNHSVPNVYGDDYKQAMYSKCQCKIIVSNVKQFTHFMAQEYKIIRNGKSAYIYNTTKGKKLYSITYSALGNQNTEKKYPDFEKIINTLEFL